MTSPANGEGLYFDDRVVEIPVRIAGEDYVLREASGEAAINYRFAVYQASRPSANGGLSDFRKLAETEPLLVSYCLYQNGQPVPISKIVKWPARYQKSLFEKAKLISGLHEVDTYRESLKEALSQDGSPVEWDSLRDFVGTLDSQKFRAARYLLEIPSEEADANPTRS